MKQGDFNNVDKGVLPFAKGSQLNSRGLSRIEKYAVLKEIFVSIYNRFMVEKYHLIIPIGETMCMYSMNMLSINEINLSHINTKGGNADLIFNLDNLQLLTAKVHDLQERRKLPKDLRGVEFKEWLKEKKLNINIRIGE